MDTYELPAPRDGWFGFRPADLVGVAATVLLTLVLMLTGALGAGLTVMVIGVAACRVPLFGASLLRWGLVWAKYAVTLGLGRHRWVGRWPFGSGDVPPALSGLALADTSFGAVVEDRASGTVTVAFEVRGANFRLLSPSDQAAAVSGWGAAMAAMARESSPVVRLGWVLVSDREPSGSHIAWAEHRGLGAESPEAVSYRELVESADGWAVQHRVVCWVTIAANRVRFRPRPGGVDRATAVARAAFDGARVWREAMELFGFVASDSLSVEELRAVVGGAVDPVGARERADLAATGVELPELGLDEGLVSSAAEFPTRCELNDLCHSTLVVAGVPQIPVPADWFAAWTARLLPAEVLTRRVCAVLVPTPPSRARRSATARISSAEVAAAKKHKWGWTVGAFDRRKMAALERHEAELAAGGQEIVTGVAVTVTATGVEELADAVASTVTTAREEGVELRTLVGSQAAGWAATLPLGRAVVGRW